MAEAGLVLELTLEQPVPITAALHCAPGELLALVGPSGGGKTTLLRCIAGLHRPHSGIIRVGSDTWFDAGKNLSRPPQQRRAGLVFQHYALFPHLTAEQNVACALGELPSAQRAACARELLALTHLKGLEARRPGQLSGGQQQRVALARALARCHTQQPSVLLLDEPFSAVDQVTRRRLQLELARLRSEVKTPIVLVTHDLEEARMLADRMTLLAQGRTLQSGTPENILRRPLSPQVARLVESHNVFEGTIVGRGEDGSARLSWRGYTLEVRHGREFQAGSRASWLIPSEDVVLHRRDRPSLGERENPLAGSVTDCLPLGEQTRIVLAVDGDPQARISFSVPTHVARRNGVEKGVAIGVSLLAEGIHLMPPQTSESAGPEADQSTD